MIRAATPTADTEAPNGPASSSSVPATDGFSSVLTQLMSVGATTVNDDTAPAGGAGSGGGTGVRRHRDADRRGKPGRRSRRHERRFRRGGRRRDGPVPRGKPRARAGRTVPLASTGGPHGRLHHLDGPDPRRIARAERAAGPSRRRRAPS